MAESYVCINAGTPEQIGFELYKTLISSMQDTDRLRIDARLDLYVKCLSAAKGIRPVETEHTTET